MVHLPPPLRLRTSTDSDQALHDALYRSTRADLALIAPDPAFLDLLLRQQQQARALGMEAAYPDAATFIVLCGDTAIGALTVEDGDERLHVIDLALFPQARNQGHGSALLRALQAKAARCAQVITLSVSLSNSAACRLYARLGFLANAHDAVQQHLRWCAAELPQP